METLTIFSEKLDLYNEMLAGIEKDHGKSCARKQAAGLVDLYSDYKTTEQKAMFVAGLFF